MGYNKCVEGVYAFPTSLYRESGCCPKVLNATIYCGILISDTGIPPAKYREMTYNFRQRPKLAFFLLKIYIFLAKIKAERGKREWNF